MKKESEREEISAIGTEGRETVFVRFGRRKPRKQIGIALCKLIYTYIYKLSPPRAVKQSRYGYVTNMDSYEWYSLTGVTAF